MDDPRALGLPLQAVNGIPDARHYWEESFRGIDAETYDFTKSKPAASLAEFCISHLHEGALILDLGCGGGRNAQFLAMQGYRVYEIDVAAAAARFCHTRFARCELSGTFAQGSFTHIPFPNASFAAVICIAALDHGTLGEAKASVAEMRRVLSPGGVILLTFDPPDTDEDIIHEAQVLSDGTLRFVRGNQKGMLFRRYNDQEITDLVGTNHIISFRHTTKGTRVVVAQ